MAYQVTATKYRPQTFDELVGQEFVAATLKNSIQNKRIANAYLLSGPRGVGKTSTARIIAKALNCVDGPTGTPCNSCDNCSTITNGYNSDVIEVDGASNTSINDVRVIQEELLYPPVNLNYKVYIIDEVHMLSKSAFNALLKTIEEPPPHVVFIFATTEINKVLATIRSRCQQFNFRLIPSDLLFGALSKVLAESGIPFEERAIKWVANEGKGSMRDSYTLLDQVVSFCDGEITLPRIQEKLGLVGSERILRIVQGVVAQNREVIFVEYIAMLEAGVAPEQIITEIIKFFRNMLFLKANLTNNKFIGFDPDSFNEEILSYFEFEDIENILEVLFKTYEKSRYSADIQTEIEICLLKLLQYKDFIRPRRILNELNNLKNALMTPGTLADKPVQTNAAPAFAQQKQTAPEQVQMQQQQQQKSPPQQMQMQQQVAPEQQQQQNRQPNPFQQKMQQKLQQKQDVRTQQPVQQQQQVQNEQSGYDEQLFQQEEMHRQRDQQNQMQSPNVQPQFGQQQQVAPGQQQQPIHQHGRVEPKPISLKPDKSEILKLLKSKVSPANFQLTAAMNNVSFVEERDKKIILHFAQQIHYDLINNHLDFLTAEVRSLVNSEYSVTTEYNPELKDRAPKTISEINKANITRLFNGQQIF